ncbi:sigma-70 family RNA polymerase sigma factor [Kitasatospora sp. NPDC047058]|uniref:RNA polymerase sigma factor n=1 Tax=Kitasatospora sp. NPDC047058 TaxID=3155620 RepID=UPI0033D19B85
MERAATHLADVVAAQAGDAAALDRLVIEALPMLYGVVGRALKGDSEVDDIVQDTMVRFVTGIDTLRNASALRPWLMAIAMNEVRRRRAHRARQPAPLESGEHLADPGADFVGLTALRVDLSGHHREVGNAAQWLGDDDRRLFALWRMEQSGSATRLAVARTLRISARHAAVRIQRMKERLSTGRLVIRALSSAPGCRALTAATGSWDGVPSPLWRKRITRHIRGCAACRADRRHRIPFQRLLEAEPDLAGAPR